MTKVMTMEESRKIESLLKELAEFKRMKEDLEGLIEGLTDQIKDCMGDAEQMVAGPYKVTWRTIVQTRLDSTALKKAMPDVAAQFTKTITTRPLRIS